MLFTYRCGWIIGFNASMQFLYHYTPTSCSGRCHCIYVVPTSSSSSASSGSAAHTWTRPSMAVRRRVSEGWKDSDWTTAFPTGSFSDKEPCEEEETRGMLRITAMALTMVRHHLVSLLQFPEKRILLDLLFHVKDLPRLHCMYLHKQIADH